MNKDGDDKYWWKLSYLTSKWSKNENPEKSRNFFLNPGIKNIGKSRPEKSRDHRIWKNPVPKNPGIEILDPVRAWPYESWCPAVSENVVVFYVIISQTGLIAAQSQVKYHNFYWQSDIVQKKDTATFFRFKPPYWISVVPIGMFCGWFNGRTWKAKL